MSSAFNPIEEFDLLCRFCGKIHPAQLDRSIAENGRTVDRNSTFEYYCTKCQKTVCFKGNDLLEKPVSPETDSEENTENTENTENIEKAEKTEDTEKKGKKGKKSKKDQKNENTVNKVPQNVIEYSPKNHYHIGEWISHKKFNDVGLVVGVDNGTPNKIIVNFEKSGIKKLIEDI